MLVAELSETVLAEGVPIGASAAGSAALPGSRVRKIRTVVSFSVTVSSVTLDRPTKSIKVFIF